MEENFVQNFKLTWLRLYLKITQEAAKEQEEEEEDAWPTVKEKVPAYAEDACVDDKGGHYRAAVWATK